MTTVTGMTTAGRITETIGAETGVAINGAGSKPAAKPSAIVIGNAVMIGPCASAMTTITATIVADKKGLLKRKQPRHRFF